MSTDKMNSTLPEEVVERLKLLVSERRRSAFVALAIEEKLQAMEAAALQEELILAYQETREEDREINREWEYATL